VSPEPEGLSPCSQQPATGPYPEPNESILHASQSVSLRSILIPSSYLRLGLPSGIFPSEFPTKTLYTLLSSPTCVTDSAHFILLDLIRLMTFGDYSITCTLFSDLWEIFKILYELYTANGFKLQAILHQSLGDVAEKRDFCSYFTKSPSVVSTSNTIDWYIRTQVDDLLWGIRPEFSLLSIKRKVKLTRSLCFPSVCLCVPPLITIEPIGRFHEIQQGGCAIEDDHDVTLLNHEASTTQKWRTIILLRWLQNLKKTTWDHEILYADRYAHD
jgi:hypothetical protein